jgi:hypothetical protein
MGITEEILREWDSADVMARKLWGKGPLEYLLPTLASLFTTDSQESKALDTIKNKQKPKMVHHPIPASTPEQSTSLNDERSCESTQPQPRLPQSSYHTPIAQRTTSGSSFGTQSTETTPNKLVHTESKVQTLQNEFVKCILTKIWANEIPLSWVNGRRMSLVYCEYCPHHFAAHYRTSPTSFQYTVRRNEEEVLVGRVKAIADGCFRLRTNKKTNPNTFCYWSKQKTVLSFEVLLCLICLMVG